MNSRRFISLPPDVVHQDEHYVPLLRQRRDLNRREECSKRRDAKVSQKYLTAGTALADPKVSAASQSAA